MVGGMLAVRILAVGVREASALGPAEGATRLPRERRQGKVSKVSWAAGWP